MIAHAIAALAYRAFEHVTDPEFAADLLYVDRPALVGEARIAGDDEQPANAAQRGDDVLHHPISEILLLRIAAHVLERQDGNRGFVRQGQTGLNRRAGRCREPHPVCPDLRRDILQFRLAEVIDLQRHLARGILLHPG